ncbi:DNA-deoxyinosine glycosylase [Fusibacter sp. JL216-2]|uniref:DNA-deoxyinosine glycosylase n=1 Tax=Fusibacter sp. JL216-2 TaxID=3071453 RepID=UPI003D32D4EF
MIKSFEPIVGKDPKVLILGSMPSVMSLEKFQYYGHPRNQFWPILATLFKEKLEHPSDDQTYLSKLTLVKDRGIAIWDVLDSCEREGSLDSNIKNESPNELKTFLEEHPTIKTIIFNGGKAEASFKKHFKALYRDKRYTYIKMPSTSPAYTLKFEKKTLVWTSILRYLD